MAEHELRSMEITPASNGGHTVRHTFKSKPSYRKGGMHGGMENSYKEPEEAVFGKDEHAKLMAHIGSKLGIGKPSKEVTEEGESD